MVLFESSHAVKKRSIRMIMIIIMLMILILIIKMSDNDTDFGEGRKIKMVTHDTEILMK